MTTPTHFVLIPAHEYEALRDDLARIRQLLEARQPEPSRHITLAKWAREAAKAAQPRTKKRSVGCLRKSEQRSREASRLSVYLRAAASKRVFQWIGAHSTPKHKASTVRRRAG